VAAAGQFSWPPAGSYLAVSGQFLVAVVRRVSEAAPVTGDEVQDTWFLDGGSWWGPGRCSGYLTHQVNDLLRQVAAELDAGRPARPLIEKALFAQRSGPSTYNVDAVDWFLGRLLLAEDHVGPDGPSADPWRDASDVTQLVLGRVSGLAQHYPPPQKPTGREAWKWFAAQCENAWRDFGQRPRIQLPGQWDVHWEPRPWRQALVSLVSDYAVEGWWNEAIRAGGRRFRFQKMDRARSSSPVIAEIAVRAARDEDGHFAKPRPRRKPPRVAGLIDEAGSPVLYISGENLERRACFCVTFPDGRWLRFPVRGTKAANAIMTAVDQAGNKVARYRGDDSGLEITVHPGQQLTDELALALAIARKRLSTYFQIPGGGG
jgi:hypothetical protein